MMALLSKALNPWVLVGLGFSVVFGLWKWTQHDLKAAKLKATGLQQSLTLAEGELQGAVSIAEHNRAVAAARDAEAKRQAGIVAAANKKALDRLRENNNLRKEVANVKDNPPVPDAIERILDFERVRGAVPGPLGPTEDDNETGSDGTPDSDGGQVSPAAPTS